MIFALGTFEPSSLGFFMFYFYVSEFSGKIGYRVLFLNLAGSVIRR